MKKTIFALIGIIFTLTIVFAQENLTVSIININKVEQLMLIDVGQGFVRPGDIFEFKNGQISCYFEVIQVHEVVSSIKVLEPTDNHDSCDAFNLLKVTDVLVRSALKPVEPVKNPVVNQAVVVVEEKKEEPLSNKEKILKLRFELAAAIKERNFMRANLRKQDKQIIQLQTQIKQLTNAKKKNQKKGVKQ